MKIEKKVKASCMPFATSNTVWTQLNDYLLACSYMERVGRSVYKITSKGEKLLERV
jgi:predicted transcriptional regulator